MTDNDRKHAHYISSRDGRLKKLLRRMTRCWWKPIISAIIAAAYEKGWITSHGFHEMNAFAEAVMKERDA